MVPNTLTSTQLLMSLSFLYQIFILKNMCNIFWETLNHFRPKFHFYTPFSGGVKMEMAWKRLMWQMEKFFGANMFRFIANKNDGLSNRRILAIQLAAIKLRKDIATLELFSEGVYFSVKLPIWVSNLLSSVVLPTLWVLKCNI